MSDNCLVCEVLMQCRELAGNPRDFPFHCAVCQKNVENNCEPVPISKQQFVSTVSSPCLSRQHVVPSATTIKEELVGEHFRSQDVLDDCFYIPRSPCRDTDYPDIQERSLPGCSRNIFQEDGPVRFEVLEKGTKRGSKLLVASDGFTYTVKVAEQQE
uniref:Uncharacterized protein LOC111107979 n=1 Tax=Crassostrea virginica TaxID=6565 RepID=A0A8B8B7N1_CRAVI|nr:uncharacterized protein LOC111107979 [Crassostrea virginica]